MKALSPSRNLSLFTSAFSSSAGASAGVLAGRDLYYGAKELVQTTTREHNQRRQEAEEERRKSIEKQEAIENKKLTLEKRTLALREKELALKEREIAALEKRNNKSPSILHQAKRSSVQPATTPNHNDSVFEPIEIGTNPQPEKKKTRCCRVM